MSHEIPAGEELSVRRVCSAPNVKGLGHPESQGWGLWQRSDCIVHIVELECSTLLLWELASKPEVASSSPLVRTRPSVYQRWSRAGLRVESPA